MSSQKNVLFLLQEQTYSGVVQNLEEARAQDSDPKNKYKGVKFKTILQEANVVNQNRRWYAKKALTEGLSQIYPNIIKPGAFYGEVSHPITKDPSRFSTILMSNASHRILETTWNGNILEGIGETLNNTVGKDMKGLVLQGVPIGFSLRAMGKVSENRSGGVSRIEEALRPFAYDFVHNPSHANALLQHVITESDISDFISHSSDNLKFLQENLTQEFGSDVEIIQREKGIVYDYKENTALICMKGSCMKVYLEEHIKKEFNSSFKKFIGC